MNVRTAYLQPTLALLGAALIGCASAQAERVYTAPTSDPVFTGTEVSYDGRGQHVFVQNSSSVENVATSFTLRNCENVKNRCEVNRIRVSVRPGQETRLATVQREDPAEPAAAGFLQQTRGTATFAGPAGRCRPHQP